MQSVISGLVNLTIYTSGLLKAYLRIFLRKFHNLSCPFHVLTKPVQFGISPRGVATVLSCGHPSGCMHCYSIDLRGVATVLS